MYWAPARTLPGLLLCSKTDPVLWHKNFETERSVMEALMRQVQEWLQNTGAEWEQVELDHKKAVFRCSSIEKVEVELVVWKGCTTLTWVDEGPDEIDTMVVRSGEDRQAFERVWSEGINRVANQYQVDRKTLVGQLRRNA